MTNKRKKTAMNLYDLPEFLEAAARVLQAIAWPIATMVIICWFRAPIARLILRLRKLKVFGEAGPSFHFDRSPSKQIPPPQTPSVVSDTPKISDKPTAASPAPPLVREKFGNVYWVGHDLLWTVAVLLNQGKREQILEGLFQSRHHLSEIGFAETPLGFRLDSLYRDAQQSSVSDWTNERRVQVAQEVQSLARELGGNIAGTQQGFKSHSPS
jgi:hypothetical protein